MCDGGAQAYHVIPPPTIHDVFENPKFGFRVASKFVSDSYIDGVSDHTGKKENHMWIRFTENPDGRFLNCENDLFSGRFKRWQFVR